MKPQPGASCRVIASNQRRECLAGVGPRADAARAGRAKCDRGQSRSLGVEGKTAKARLARASFRICRQSLSHAIRVHSEQVASYRPDSWLASASGGRGSTRGGTSGESNSMAGAFMISAGNSEEGPAGIAAAQGRDPGASKGSNQGTHHDSAVTHGRSEVSRDRRRLADAHGRRAAGLAEEAQPGGLIRRSPGGRGTLAT